MGMGMGMGRKGSRRLGGSGLAPIASFFTLSLVFLSRLFPAFPRTFPVLPSRNSFNANILEREQRSRFQQLSTCRISFVRRRPSSWHDRAWTPTPQPMSPPCESKMAERRGVRLATRTCWRFPWPAKTRRLATAPQECQADTRKACHQVRPRVEGSISRSCTPPAEASSQGVHIPPGSERYLVNAPSVRPPGTAGVGVGVGVGEDARRLEKAGKPATKSSSSSADAPQDGDRAERPPLGGEEPEGEHHHETPPPGSARYSARAAHLRGVTRGLPVRGPGKEEFNNGRTNAQASHGVAMASLATPPGSASSASMRPAGDANKAKLILGSGSALSVFALP